MRRLRWVLAVALVGVGLSLPAQAALAPCGPTSATGRFSGSTEALGGGWIGSAPNYLSGHAESTLYASPAFDPNLLFVSNGSVLMRSVDAGCSWAQVFDSAAAARRVPGEEVAITALNVPSSANNSRFVYLGITRTPVTGVPTPAIAVSGDRGGSFAVQTSGLPVIGSVTGVAGNAQVPEVAYASVDTGLAGSSQQVYGSTDGGSSWTQRTPAGESFDGSQLITHPTTQTQLFAVAGGKVMRSDDGGASFLTVTPGGSVSRLSAAPGGGGLRLVAGRTDGSVASSTDLGGSWSSVAAPTKALSVAAAPLQSVVAVSGARGVFLLEPAARDISPDGSGPSDLSISAPTAGGYAITGLRGGELLRVTVDPNGQPIMPVVGPGGRVRPIALLPPGPVTQFPSLIQPSGLRVSLAAGETRLVPYRLLVPRTPTPVDMLFAVDSTNSMAPVIEDLRTAIRDIVNSLNGAGLNVRVGVGDFRDYPGPEGPAARGDYPWRLRRAIGPVDLELEGELNRLTTGGGTQDGGTSGYAAMYQSTTGNDLEDGQVVPLDQEIAGYRPGSLRLAMLASDAPSHEGGVRGEPGPNSDQVIAALQQHHVHSVGLAIVGGETDPTRYMRLLAEGSSTYAPGGGVDCDGNGRVELDEGSPLVCRLTYTRAGTGPASAAVPQRASAAGLTAAVVGLAAGIPDLQAVGARVTQGAAFAAVRSAPRTVNLRADNELPFQLELHCPVGQGSHQRVGVVGAAGARVLVQDSVDLTCGGIPVAAPAAVVAAAVPPAPAPAQPAPNPQPQPNPNPNPNPNPAVNINVNPGVADQQEQMPQLAMAESAETEAATMSGWAFVTVAGLLTCTAGGLALRRREQLSF